MYMNVEIHPATKFWVHEISTTVCLPDPFFVVFSSLVISMCPKFFACRHREESRAGTNLHIFFKERWFQCHNELRTNQGHRLYNLYMFTSIFAGSLEVKLTTI